MPDWSPQIQERLRGLNLDPVREAEIVEELTDHLNEIYRDLRARGIGEDKARLAALDELDDIKPLARALALSEKQAAPLVGPGVRGTNLMDNLFKDLMYGFRMLRKAPGFAIVVILTLALGIGANSAIFTVFNAVVLRPLPYPDPHELVRLLEVMPDGTLFSVSHPNFIDWRDQNRSFQHMAAWQSAAFNLVRNGEAQNVRGANVSADFINVLGVAPTIGRNFTAEEDRFGTAERAVLVGYDFWRTSLGGDPSILGSTLILNEVPHTVVGVLPQTFRWGVAQVFTPLNPNPRRGRGDHRLGVIGRLKPDALHTEASNEMAIIGRQLSEQFPSSNGGWSITVQSMYDWFVPEETRQSLIIALAAVGLVLLIALTNVANLLLARASARQKELSIRMAIGAGRLRVFSQLFFEVLLLALIGGAVGLGLAFATSTLLTQMNPDSLPRIEEISLDVRVVLFTFGVSVLAGLIFGLIGSIQASRSNVSEALKEAGRSGGGSLGLQRLRGVLVILEVAISVALLVGAGLLFRSFWVLQKVEPGYDVSNLLTMNVNLPSSKYADEKVWEFYSRLLPEAEALPGVESAAINSIFPMTGGNTSMAIFVDGMVRGSGNTLPNAGWRIISPNYFKTLGVSLRGRDFTEHDNNFPSVAIISDSMASRFWPNSDPIGKTFDGWGSPESRFTIVGIAGDIRSFGLDQEDGPMVYLPLVGASWNPMTLVIRTANDPASHVNAVRNVVRSLDSNVPVYSIQTANELIETSVGSRRFNMFLLTCFAIIALALASIGLFGVMAYLVSQRKHEIGVRLALGAGTSNIFRLVIGRGMLLAGLGSVIGLIAAFWLSRSLEAFLFRITSRDPVTFAGVLILLLLVAFLACYIPARRATRVDPLVALRHE